MLRRLLPLLICLFCALPVAAQNVLRIGNGPDSESLDPHRAVGAGDSRILTSLFEGLLTPDAAGRMVPGAAERWSVSEDGLTYTFTLRADGRWSDGTQAISSGPGGVPWTRPPARFSPISFIPC